MKLVIAMILSVITISTPSAQTMFGNPPKIVTYTNKATGEKIGSAVISRNIVVLRDRHDVHYASILLQPDGTRKWVDPSGNPIDPKTTLLPLE
jgi:hypothetical protein